eukprot:scaffold103764_cov60-Phaeocystis_antarctica.AAC.2
MRGYVYIAPRCPVEVLSCFLPKTSPTARVVSGTLSLTRWRHWRARPPPRWRRWRARGSCPTASPWPTRRGCGSW